MGSGVGCSGGGVQVEGCSGGGVFRGGSVGEGSKGANVRGVEGDQRGKR